MSTAAQSSAGCSTFKSVSVTLGLLLNSLHFSRVGGGVEPPEPLPTSGFASSVAD